MTFLKITQRGAPELKAAFKKIPEGAKPLALNSFTAYVIGNPSHGLKHYPNYISPTYVRTYRLRNAWYAVPAVETRAYVANPTPYAIYPMGTPPTQVMRRIGWRSALDVVFSNMTGGIRAAEQAVMRWVKGLFS